VVITAQVVSDFLSIVLAFGLGYFLYPTFGHGDLPGQGLYLRITLLAAAGGLFIFERLGLYRKQVSLLNVDETRRIIQADLTLGLFLFAYSFFTKTSLSPLLLSLSLGTALVLITAERMGFHKLHQALHLRGLNVHRVLIIGAGEVGFNLFQVICRAPQLGYGAVGFFDEDRDLMRAAWERVETENRKELLFLDKKEAFLEAVLSKKMDEVFIARSSLSPERLQEIVSLCRRFNIAFSYVPYLYGQCMERVAVNDLHGVPMVTARKIRFSTSERIGKRCLDLVLSVLALILLWPSFLMVAALIRIDSAGPVLFRQTRVGEKGRTFRILKFRTMHADSPAYMDSPCSPMDPRITTVGRFLRRTSLDELPQLINVIRGDMSLVGPRPEMPYVVAGYNELQRERLSVRPGITGLWQISADRERPIHENISYDIYYIKNRSLLLDLAILVRTALFALASRRTC